MEGQDGEAYPATVGATRFFLATPTRGFLASGAGWASSSSAVAERDLLLGGARAGVHRGFAPLLSRRPSRRCNTHARLVSIRSSTRTHRLIRIIVRPLP